MDLASKDLDDVVDEAGELLGLYEFDVLFCEPLGGDAFEQPGACPPILGRGLPHGIERSEFSGEAGTAQLLAEFVVAPRFAMNGAGGATDIARGGGDSGASGDECADFAALWLVEPRRTA